VSAAWPGRPWCRFVRRVRDTRDRPVPMGPDAVQRDDEDDDGHEGRTARPRSAGRWLAVSLGLYVTFATAYMVVVPPFEGHDVQAHFAAVQHYRKGLALPTIDAQTLSESFELVTQPPLYHLLAAVAASGWPVDESTQLARDSMDPYFGGRSAYRQSETLPRAPARALVPAEIARLVSLMGGALVFLGTWWTARTLVPERPAFAAAAAAVATFNPFFLFLSTTITNDALAAGFCALALAAGFDAWHRCRRPAWWLGVGALYGLAAITKYSSLFVGLPLSLLWVHYALDRGAARQAGGATCRGVGHADGDGRRRGLEAAGLSAAGFALAAGWWFLRDVRLYGEWVPLHRMAEAIPALNRVPPWSVAHTVAYVPWLVSSFWGVFVALIAPTAYLNITRVSMLLGLVGVPVAIGRAVRARRNRLAVAQSILALWLAAVAIAVLYWTRTVTFGEQARLGFIGLSAFGILMVSGWEAWLPRRHQPRAHVALVGAMTCLALWLVPFLHDAYALPRPIDDMARPDRTIDARFAPGMRVVGVDFPRGAAIDPAGSMPVRVYLTTDRTVDADYTLFLHASDANDRLLYRYDGAPAGGRHPTRQWRPGEVFVDAFDIAPSLVLTETVLATLSLGFYPFEQPAARLDAEDGAHRSIGDRVVLGRIRLSAEPVASTAAPPPDPVASWRSGVVLDAAEVERDADGAPTGVRVTWTTTRTLQSDYVVFAQVLGCGNEVLAQSDRQPCDGTWPTSTWRSGDVITDTLRWTGELSGWRRLIIGLYGLDGARVPLSQPGATFPDAVDIVARPQACRSPTGFRHRAVAGQIARGLPPSMDGGLSAARPQAAVRVAQEGRAAPRPSPRATATGY
jgi:hypothetical protein